MGGPARTLQESRAPFDSPLVRSPWPVIWLMRAITGYVGGRPFFSRRKYSNAWQCIVEVSRLLGGDRFIHPSIHASVYLSSDLIIYVFMYPCIYVSSTHIPSPCLLFATTLFIRSVPHYVPLYVLLPHTTRPTNNRLRPSRLPIVTHRTLTHFFSLYLPHIYLPFVSPPQVFILSPHGKLFVTPKRLLSPHRIELNAS